MSKQEKVKLSCDVTRTKTFRISNNFFLYWTQRGPLYKHTAELNEIKYNTENH